MAYDTGLFRNDSTTNLHSPDNRVRERDAEVVNEIIADVIGSSAALTLADVSSTDSRETVFRVQNSLPSAYWIKGTTDALSGNPNDGSRAAKDVAMKQTTSMTWREVKMEAEEMAVVVPLPDTWKADSDVDFDEIKPLIVEQMHLLLDEAILFGGDLPASWAANGFNGVLVDALANGNVVVVGTGEDLADDIALLAETMEEDGYEVNGFVTYPGYRWKFVRLRSDDGVPIYSPLTDSPSGKGLYGVPLVPVKNGAWNTHKDDVSIIAGDWSNLKVKIRQDFEFKVSDSAPIFDTSGALQLNTFQQDATVMRVTFRVAAGVVNPVKRLGGEYPFSVLIPDADYSS